MADDPAGKEQKRPAEDFDPTADFFASMLEAYVLIRERMAAGGPGWTPKEPPQ